MDVMLTVPMDLKDVNRLNAVAKREQTTVEAIVKHSVIGTLAAKTAEYGGRIRVRNNPVPTKTPPAPVQTKTPDVSGIPNLRLRAAVLDADPNRKLRLRGRCTRNGQGKKGGLPRGLFLSPKLTDGERRITVQVNYYSKSRGRAMCFSAGAFKLTELVDAMRHHDYVARLLQGKQAWLHFPQTGERDVNGKVV